MQEASKAGQGGYPTPAPPVAPSGDSDISTAIWSIRPIWRPSVAACGPLEWL